MVRLEIIALSAFTLCAAPASAQTCASRDAMVAGLAERFGELRQSIGLAQTSIVEVYANPATGTWTVTVTGPTMLSCIVAAGEAFQIDAPAPAGVPG